MSTKRTWGWVWLVLVLAAGAWGAWWLLTAEPLYRSRPDEGLPAERRLPPVSELGGSSGGAPQQPKKRTPPLQSDECRPKVDRDCVHGDVWWIDSCGQPHERFAACRHRPCREGSCVEDDPRCVPPAGGSKCEGEVATGCAAGRYFAVDCAAQGRRCVMGEEGPVCRVPTAEDCRPGRDRAHCEDEELLTCSEGQWVRWDCARQWATCEEGPGGARCVRSRPLPGAEEACGVCGCPPSFDTPEVCDGRDNDGDGFVDENLECPVVVLQPIVITDAEGNDGYSEEALMAELDRLNRDFARDDGLGLEFTWAPTVRVPNEDWRIVRNETVDPLFRMERPVHPEGEPMIPVFFVEELWMDEVPRPGLSTTPNGMCGGQRRTPHPQPGSGGIVIAEQRWPTTLSHEVGHYLGLCHTHQSVDEVLVLEDPQQSAACREPCALEGDGICDTPPDPGPPQCIAGPDCVVSCEEGSQPESENLMSYYPVCRSRFSADQARLMRYVVALRRGWHRCLEDPGCTCDPLQSQCPEGMTCARMESAGGAAWMCALEGATLPGGRCEHPAECSHDSTCVLLPTGEGRCARPCARETDDCDCRSFDGVDVALCGNDLETAPE